uniref:galactokinase n=1 Tax=Flavobacterium sp. TaxID=239 RepID=UPI00404BA2DC
MKKELVKEVKKAFKNQFKTKPQLVFSPGRINLIGEHTDYNDGFVFPAAINKGIALAINKSKSEKSQVFAHNKGESFEFSVDDFAPIKGGNWRNYILGVVSEIQKRGLKVPNFNAVFAGNIPSGAGMSSSAALENSFVFGLNDIFDLGLSKSEMILISQKAEHNYAGVQCGIMDQFASMFGIENSALLLDCRTMESKPFLIDFKKYTLMLINTNVKHDLSESAYNNRRFVCETIAKKLNKTALRDVSESELNEIKSEISESDYQKALYVIQENLRAQSFAEAIQKDDLETLGKLLYASHEGLSSQYHVSCEELDFLVHQAKENPNVLGGRMMGGGFGGCTINLVLKNDFKRFKKEISEQYFNEFGKSCSVYKVKLSKGTHKVTN